MLAQVLNDAVNPRTISGERLSAGELGDLIKSRLIDLHDHGPDPGSAGVSPESSN
jgi:hypothetical protein